MGIEHRGLVTGTGRFTLRAVGAGITEFCWTEDLVFPTTMGGGLGERAGRPGARADLAGQPARLRDLAEA